MHSSEDVGEGIGKRPEGARGTARPATMAPQTTDDPAAEPQIGQAETRESATSRGAGSSTAAAGSPHCMIRGNRKAITAPSSNNPALTSDPNHR